MATPGDPAHRRGALAVALVGLAAVLGGVVIVASDGQGDLLAPEQPVELGRPLEPDGDATADGGDPTSTAPTTSPRSFTLAAAGDLLVHMPVARSAATADGGYDFAPLLAGIAPTVSAADWAICHQETPVSADSTGLSGYPLFNAPREVAEGARAIGFDACEATSNHSLDQGFAGVVETLDVFDEVGLAHTGTGRTAEEQRAAAIYDVGGVAVGHLAYTYSYNGIPSPAEAPWLAELLWPQVGVAAVVDHAAELRARGAEVVVVSMQWGVEYQQAPTAEQRQWARDLLASPEIDLILGDHVHVIQPCEVIDGEYVHYGMGNLLSNQSPAAGLLPSTQDGVVVTYRFDEVEPGRFSATSMTYAPTVVEIPGHRVVPATPERHPQSHQRTVEAMGALGEGACDAVPAY